MQQPTVFRHIVGRSTLKEGITVRKDFEDWFSSPDAGCKREITLLFDKDKETKAILRRLNNRGNHVQIKYETAKYSPFREWLQNTFKESSIQVKGELLEFHKISENEYSLNPITLEMLDGTNLRISKTLYHGGAESVIPYIPVFEEVSQVIKEVDFRAGKTQVYYNQKLREGFICKGWSTEKPIIDSFNLRFDHRKENVQLEIEFGNARSYYQDYIKFSIAFNEGLITLGGLITPTSDFANVLCEVGRDNAWQKAKKLGFVKKPTYSGMMTFEKAALEFQYLKFMLNMPIVVMGIDYKDSF